MFLEKNEAAPNWQETYRARITTADEAVMGAAADGVGGFEILDETGERVKTRFQQFLME